MQDKEAEMKFSKNELKEGTWENSKSQIEIRKKDLELIASILSRDFLVLDAGCGPGTYGLLLAEQGNNVVGIDISVDNIKIAKKRAKEKGCETSLIVGDLDKLPFKEDTFDVCLCAYTLHHFPELVSPISEFHRVCKQKSRIALIEPNGSNPIVNLSGAVENVLRSILYNLGLDTPNEKLHGLVYYSLALKEQGFVNIETNFPCLTGLPPLPPLCLKIGVVRFISLVPIHIGVRLRYMLLRITDSILSFPLAGANMLILGMKSSTVNENALKSRFNDCTRGK